MIVDKAVMAYRRRFRKNCPGSVDTVPDCLYNEDMTTTPAFKSTASGRTVVAGSPRDIRTGETILVDGKLIVVGALLGTQEVPEVGPVGFADYRAYTAPPARRHDDDNDDLDAAFFARRTASGIYG